MLFYMILVFLQIQAMVNSFEAPTMSNEKKFVDAVNNYRKQFDVAFEYFQTTQTSIDKISEEVLELFRQNIYILLHQLSNVHYKTMETAVKINKENDKRTIFKLIYNQTPFEKAVCLFVPRCLDFIYDLTADVSAFIEMYQFYFLRCIDWKRHMAEICSLNEDYCYYSCDTDQINKLYNYVEEFPNQSMRSGFGVEGAQFLENVVDYMHDIDKITILTTRLYLHKPSKVFGEVQNDFFKSRGLFPLYEPRIDKINELDETFRRLNKDFGNILSENPTKVFMPEDTVDLVTRAFMVLQTYFQSKIENEHAVTRTSSENSVAEMSRNDFAGKLKNIFNDFCEQASLVMVYLMDNYCTDEDCPKIKVLFGLQLTYCGDWKNILITRCPEVQDERKERVCMVNTISDRLLMNIYWTTREAPGSFDKKAPGYEVISSASNYLTQVHRAIVKYFEDVTPAVPVWTRSEWLTGKYILGSTEHGCAETFEIRTKEISIYGDKSVISFQLGYVYKIMLPWISIVEHVFKFHEVLTRHVELTMNDYFYRHGKIIELYIRHIPDKINNKILKRLVETITWYTEGAKHVCEYLSLPGVCKGPNELVKNVISAINNCSAQTTKTLRSCNIMKTIPADKRDELSRWVEKRLKAFENKGYSYQVQLNQMFLYNCRAALVYINIVLSYVHCSGVIKEKETIDLDESHCGYIQKIFTNESVLFLRT